MDELGFISKILDGRIVLGKREEINNLIIIPVYKIKIINFDLKNIEKSLGNCLFVSPICLLKINGNDVSIIDLKQEEKVIKDTMPDFMSGIDISNLLKNIKIN